MKTRKLNWMLLPALVLFVSTAFAQPMQGPCMGKCGAKIPGLTEEQQKQIDKFSVAHQKQMLDLRNQLQEKKARYQTLMTKDVPDMKAINQTIDEMGALKTQMMKARAEHHQMVRKDLNEEQRLFFDTHFGKGMGMKVGKHREGKRMGRHQRMNRDCPNQERAIIEEEILKN